MQTTFQSSLWDGRMDTFWADAGLLSSSVSQCLLAEREPCIGGGRSEHWWEAANANPYEGQAN